MIDKNNIPPLGTKLVMTNPQPFMLNRGWKPGMVYVLVGTVRRDTDTLFYVEGPCTDRYEGHWRYRFILAEDLSVTLEDLL